MNSHSGRLRSIRMSHVHDIVSVPAAHFRPVTLTIYLRSYNTIAMPPLELKQSLSGVKAASMAVSDREYVVVPKWKFVSSFVSA
jgi:hypothetical protein